VLLGVDVGGTFTDAVIVTDDGDVHAAKVASTPRAQERGVLAAVRLVLERAGARGPEVTRFAHGMTVATNALLEGKTARTALIATEGFTDVIELARQARPELYRLCAAPPTPLVPDELRFAAPERMGPDGPQRALDEDAARALVEDVARARPQAVAVALLHSYAHPDHERALGVLIGEVLGDVHVSLSCEVVGTFREYERTATTVLDAALSPLLAGYLERLRDDARAEGLPEAQIMQSSGGLTESARAAEHAALTVLSGPAGGVGGALLLAGVAATPDVLCFDMGGTSCDVCVIEGSQVAESAERTVAGRPLALPSLDIHTVGAGGGSIAWRDTGGALRVGPASAGAEPGPACYGRGGLEPTVTDANLLLGRLFEDRPLAGGLRLERPASERAVGTLAYELGISTRACAEGIVRIAEAEMLAALRLVTLERGVDPRGFTLMPFGGAGPMHAAAMASELGIERVLCPRASGVLCALGLAAAAPRRDASRTVMLDGETFTDARVRAERDSLAAEARAALGAPAARTRARYELRYRGQSFELPVELPDTGASAGAGSAPDDTAAALRAAFARVHEERYGYGDAHADVELVTMRVSVWGAAPAVRVAAPSGERAAPSGERAAADDRPAEDERRVVFDGEERATRVLLGELAAGTSVRGPAVCAQTHATVLVPPGWSGVVDQAGSLLLRREP
jgi:N-methylhydantoinase A